MSFVKKKLIKFSKKKEKKKIKMWLVICSWIVEFMGLQIIK